jgi:hypothetical protein
LQPKVSEVNMRRSCIAAGALLTMVIVGCGSSPAPPAGTARSAVPAQALRVACPGNQTQAARRSAALPERSVPARFTPVAVVLCTPAVVFVNGNGRNMPQTRLIAAADLGSLMTALRHPSAPPNSSVACMDQRTYVDWFVLVAKNGQVIRPKIPVTVCGDPSPAVLAGLNALRFRSVR